MATVLAPGSAERLTALSDTYEADLARLGERLRRAREHRGLTLVDVVNETKIPQRHLEALEQGNLGTKAAGFYARAEIRAYANAVGLDQKMVLAQLDSALKPREPEPVLQIQSPQPKFPRAQALIAAGFVTALAVAFWAERASVRPPESAETHNTPRQGLARVLPAPIATPTVTVQGDQAQTGQGDVVTSPDNELPPAAAAEIPPPAASVTELVVATEPTGARVTVNGIGWGTSPVTIRHLPPGDKRVRVTMEGYAPVERVVPLAEGGRRALDIRLTNEP